MLVSLKSIVAVRVNHERPNGGEVAGFAEFHRKFKAALGFLAQEKSLTFRFQWFYGDEHGLGGISSFSEDFPASSRTVDPQGKRGTGRKAFLLVVPSA